VFEATLWIPVALPVLQADVMQRHVRAKYRKQWHELVRWALLDQAGPRPLMIDEMGIECTRRAPGRRPDYVNLVYS